MNLVTVTFHNGDHIDELDLILVGKLSLSRKKKKPLFGSPVNQEVTNVEWIKYDRNISRYNEMGGGGQLFNRDASFEPQNRHTFIS